MSNMAEAVQSGTPQYGPTSEDKSSTSPISNHGSFHVTPEHGAASDDLSLTSPITHHRPFHVRERSNSESDLKAFSEENISQLDVDRKHVNLGDKSVIKVEWDIKEDVGADDLIGLYPANQKDSSQFLDSKNRGVNGGQKGQILWDLHEVAHHFNEGNVIGKIYISLFTFLLKKILFKPVLNYS